MTENIINGVPFNSFGSIEPGRSETANVEITPASGVKVLFEEKQVDPAEPHEDRKVNIAATQAARDKSMKKALDQRAAEVKASRTMEVSNAS